MQGSAAESLFPERAPALCSHRITRRVAPGRQFRQFRRFHDSLVLAGRKQNTIHRGDPLRLCEIGQRR